jgi:hypothetical protein
MKVDALKVARFMYERQAEEYGAEKDQIEEVWGDSDIRKFWTEEAEAVLGFLGFSEAAR